MIQITSTKTEESKAVPGVRYTVRALNRIQRAARDLPLLDMQVRIANLLKEWGDINTLLNPSGTPEADLKQSVRMIAIDAEYTALRALHIKPAVIRAGLVSLEGLEVDGQPATADLLMTNSGPEYDELIDEIYDACQAAAGLTSVQTKNSQSDTTSTGQVAPDPTTRSIAPSAGA